MSSIRKRILPSGETRWQVDYKDQSGKRRARQFKTKKEAVDYEITAGGEIRAGTHVADSASVTIQQAGELWLAKSEGEQLEPSTVRQYRQHLRLHIVPFIGEMKLSRLSVPAVEAFRDDLLKNRSKALTRKVLTSLKSTLKEAQRRGLVNRNAADQTQVRMSSRHKSKVQIPAKDEIRAILLKSAELWPFTKVENTRRGERRIVAVPWRPLIVVAVFTGLRCSELRGLTWENVALSDGLIRVRQRADFRGVMGLPKSEAGNRDVPLPPMVINTLKAWKLACPKTAGNLVFPGRTGEIPSTANIHRQVWRPLLRALELVDYEKDCDGNSTETPRYTFHHLRHAAASLLIEQNWSPKKVQAIMGHSSIQMTFDLYGHLWKTLDDDARGMAEIETRLFS